MNTRVNKLRFKWVLSVLLISTLGFSQPPEMVAKPARLAKLTKPVKSVKYISKVQSEDTSINGNDKTIEVRYPIDFRPNVHMTLYDTKTDILPARGNSIEIYLNYVAEGKNPEDLRKLHQAIEDNLINLSGNRVDISMEFYNSYKKNTGVTGFSAITIKLKDGSKIKLSKFRITDLRIYLPADMDFNLDAKYCPVDIAFSINGKVDIKAFDAEIKGKRISGDFDLNGKYSRIDFEAVTGSSSIDLYESKLWISTVKNLKMNSKYSHVTMDALASIVVNGFEDDYKFTQVPVADFDVKYTDIKLDRAETVKAKLFEGGLDIHQANYLKLQAKYADGKFGVIQKVDLMEGFENELAFNEVAQLISADGQYNEISVEQLTQSVKISGFEDEINIEQIAPEFKFIDIRGKYQDIDLVAPKKAAYKFYGNITYPSLDFDQDDFRKVLHDKKGSKLRFEYYHGKAESYAQEIKLEGFEVTLELHNQ